MITQESINIGNNKQAVFMQGKSGKYELQNKDENSGYDFLNNAEKAKAIRMFKEWQKKKVLTR